MSATRDDSVVFYTVREAAEILRVDPATIYRAIRANAFPAVRVRTRYIVPRAAVERLASDAAATSACIDIAAAVPRPRSEQA